MELELGTFPTTAFDDMSQLGIDATVTAWVNVPGPQVILQHSAVSRDRYWYGVDQLRAILAAYDQQFPPKMPRVVVPGYEGPPLIGDLTAYLSPDEESPVPPENPHPQPEWLPRLTRDMAIEMNADTELTRALTEEGLGKQAIRAVLERAANVGIGLASSYISSEVSSAVSAWKDHNEQQGEQIDKLRAQVKPATERANRVEAENGSLRQAVDKAEALIATRDRELAELRGVEEPGGWGQMRDTLRAKVNEQTLYAMAMLSDSANQDEVRLRVQAKVLGLVEPRLEQLNAENRRLRREVAARDSKLAEAGVQQRMQSDLLGEKDRDLAELERQAEQRDAENLELRRRLDESHALINMAMQLHQYGERAPGGDETWAQFEREARRLVGPVDEDGARVAEQDPPEVPAGTWVAAFADMSSVATFGSEVECLRYAVEHSMGARLVPHGTPVEEAFRRG